MPGHYRPRMLAVLCLAVAAAGCGGRILNAPHPTSSAHLPSPSSARGVDLRIDNGQFAGTGSPPEVREWVEQATQAIDAYYGRFPVPHARLQLERVDGSGVRWARTFAHAGAFIRVGVGAETSGSELASDWILTHEFVHLALPQLADEHDWLQEGAATYVEPIARAQAGQLSPERVWAEFALGMPRGLPAEGDLGLDFTPTWARTYWGGALFLLVADVKIRIRTGNRVGLQQALRAILEAGGTLEHRWSIREALKAGDDATGVDVLTQMYEEWHVAPVQVDLAQLWRELGVEPHGRWAGLRNDAPMADIRRAITARAPITHPQAYAGD